jgi:hypothetical protein
MHITYFVQNFKWQYVEIPIVDIASFPSLA